MELVAIFLLFLVLAFVVLFVTLPFFQRQRIGSAENDQEYSSLQAERDRLLTALEELDFDQSLGKIPAEDYPMQRSGLLQKGAAVLRQLDLLSPKRANQPDERFLYDSTISQITSPLSDNDLEDLLSKRRNNRKEKNAGFCPRCGKPVLKSDVFCTTCGSPLK
jgi:hypothetical protein